MAETKNIPVPPLRSVPRQVILSLLELLGHDPNKVTQLTIHPGYITVEYTHPILNDKPAADVFLHEVKDDRP